MTLPNILQIHIEEPNTNPSKPSLHHALADDLNDAEKRYRSIIRMLISQLTGLADTHVKFIISPAEPEAIDAVSFWLLPLFRGKVCKQGELFHFSPEQNAPSFTIEFSIDPSLPEDQYLKYATLSPFCPQCSSRWINAAFTQCSETHKVIGENYLTIQHQKLNSQASNTDTSLPPLPLIQSAADWELAMNSPVGPKLKKFYQEL